MKKWLTFLFLFTISTMCFCQTQTGAYYLNAEQLKNNTPAGNINFTTKKFKRGEIMVKPAGDTLKRSFITRKIFALNINDTIWINGFRQKIGNTYYPTLTKGNFIAFRGCMENSKSGAIIIPTSFGFGLVGGIVAAVIIAPKRYLYVTSLRTGNTKRLNIDYIQHRLEESKNTELLNTFNAEKDKKSAEVLLKYVSLLNEFAATNPVEPVNKN